MIYCSAYFLAQKTSSSTRVYHTITTTPEEASLLSIPNPPTLSLPKRTHDRFVYRVTRWDDDDDDDDDDAIILLHVHTWLPAAA